MHVLRYGVKVLESRLDVVGSLLLIQSVVQDDLKCKDAALSSEHLVRLPVKLVSFSLVNSSEFLFQIRSLRFTN